jgi:methionyl-tRNA synthetase
MRNRNVIWCKKKQKKTDACERSRDSFSPVSFKNAHSVICGISNLFGQSPSYPHCAVPNFAGNFMGAVTG